MSPSTINALVTTFPGLPNYTLPLSPTTSISALHSQVLSLLPSQPINRRLLLSTTSGHILPPTDTLTPISTLTDGHDFLTLRLHPTLCGGKGGFGSQLRAAGGRMSSRKKRGQQENNDSCRNLDGRRMRTVKEAKALAAYLEIKPDMDRKEREKRRERALKIIEAADRKEDGKGKRFEDVKWLEETEEERERTREAVLRAMKEGFTDRTFTGEVDAGGSSGSGSDEDESEGSGSKKVIPRFAGWDEDDEFMSPDEEDEGEDEEDEEDEDEDEEAMGDVKMEAIKEEDEDEDEGKGKEKATA